MKRKRSRFDRLMLPTMAVGAVAVCLLSTQAEGVLIISEYVEGTSNNKAIEIYNNGTSSVDLGATSTTLQMFFNGSTSAGTTVSLTGVIAPGDVFVLAQASSNASILAVADQTSASSFYNGDDAIVLFQGATAIDSIGQVGNDPGTEWGAGLTSTADNTIRRKFAINVGDTNTGDSFDPSIEWDGFATDTFGGLGSHSGAAEPPPPPPPAPFTGTLFINEVDYDQPSTDTAEFIELAGLAGTYENVQLLLINGSGNTIYATINIPTFTLTDEADGFGFYVLSGNAATVPNTDLDLTPDTNLIQNGAPDAIALLIDGEVVHYLSYAGNTTLLIGGTGFNDGGTGLVDSTDVGLSLQKVGTGSEFDDFTFSLIPVTPGAVNTGQTFVAAAALVPEPATFGLLGVAGLTLVRRRRHA